jgi:hypothetical protein
LNLVEVTKIDRQVQLAVGVEIRDGGIIDILPVTGNGAPAVNVASPLPSSTLPPLTPKDATAKSSFPFALKSATCTVEGLTTVGGLLEFAKVKVPTAGTFGTGCGKALLAPQPNVHSNATMIPIDTENLVSQLPFMISPRVARPKSSMVMLPPHPLYCN